MAAEIKRSKAINLFSGAGVCCAYCKDIGVDIVLANELSLDRAELHAGLYPECQVVVGSITNPQVKAKIIKFCKENAIEGILCSPCCQSYCVANTHKDSKDYRRLYFMDVFEILEAVKTDWMVIENAKEFKNTRLPEIGGKTIEEYIRARGDELGYYVNIAIQDSADYGTPQHRRRTICLLSKKELGEWKFPPPTTPGDKQITVEQAFKSLPKKDDYGLSGHWAHCDPYTPKAQADSFIGVLPGGRAKNPVKADGSPSGARFQGAHRRKWLDRPSNSILTGSDSVAGFYNTHPTENRPCTLAELFVLFGLPVDWKIPSRFRTNERLIREVLGEAWAPLHTKALLETRPRRK